ncbi:MAG: DUF1576 domain-containing protein, partial [Lachnospiraceae bacterium]|nr:DUF1576 domain-containing protein [Lachnospiraceae bacterium]
MMMTKVLAYDPKQPSRAVTRLALFTAFALVLFGLVAEGNPAESVRGVFTIFTSEGTLITDYIAMAGMGSAFLNSGLVMLLAIGTISGSGYKFDGSSLGACYMSAG